jgi:hypothetical protein
MGPGDRAGDRDSMRVVVVVLAILVAAAGGALIAAEIGRHVAATPPITTETTAASSAATSTTPTSTSSTTTTTPLEGYENSTQGAADVQTVATGCQSVDGLMIQLAGAGNNPGEVASVKGSGLANVALMAGAGTAPIYHQVAADAGRASADYGAWERSGSSAALSSDISAVAADCAVFGDPTGNS